jgi:hypothetical protein
MQKETYHISQQGIVYGPYGYIGYVGTIKREDLKEVVDTFFGLFRLARYCFKRFWKSYKKSFKNYLIAIEKNPMAFTSLF